MGRGSYKHLLQLAKKKPAVKVLLDNVDVMSDVEIDSLTGVQQWIKKQLKNARRINAANKLANECLKSVNDEVVTYKAYKYTGPACVAGTPLDIEVDSGDLIVVLQPNILKVNSTSVKMDLAQVDMLLLASTYFGEMTIEQYNHDYLQPYLSEKYGIVLEEERSSIRFY